jgi:hypothetical protein
MVPMLEGVGPAPKRIVVAYGFWIFLLSDIVMFSALFAAYAVLVHATAGGLAVSVVRLTMGEWARQADQPHWAQGRLRQGARHVSEYRYFNRCNRHPRALGAGWLRPA